MYRFAPAIASSQASNVTGPSNWREIELPGISGEPVVRWRASLVRPPRPPLRAGRSLGEDAGRRLPLADDTECFLVEVIATQLESPVAPSKQFR